jgi:tetratricopeptide (TPR) repeat protein
MMGNGLPTHRRVSFALGYTALGMLNEASEELEAIGFEDRFLPEVLSARIDLHMEAKHWDALVGLGRRLATDCPHKFQGWMSWAYALKELNRPAEARAVLLEAEPLHGEKCALLHYNLACYECVLGSLDQARERLRRACLIDPDFKNTALDDSDLQPIWGELRSV